jgi:hypothetical protein
MKKVKTILLILIIAIITGGCEEKADKEFPIDVPDTIVVEAILTNEKHNQEIKITRPVATQSQQPDAVSGAEVSLSNGNQSTNCTESIDNPGVYFSDISFAAALGQTYYLSIIYNGKSYNAETQMVPVIPLTPLTYTPADNTDSLFKIGWVASDYDAETQNMYEIEIDWSHLSGYQNTDSTKAKLFYYTFKTLDVIMLFPPDKEEVFFPKGSIIIERKYSLTDDYAEYLRALNAETVWQGSLFDEARGNLPSNIDNGGLGFFAACSVVADTIIVE